ncbi:PAS domain S-box protein [Methanolacinia paynteri]|uniref:PAS domain S-box protein n=1 Tax=Methanolacinia paynteri TaxID=230356 RepID=UPI00064FACA4|nr:PAS domain S-box protein [Methanolacinia paynteri]
MKKSFLIDNTILFSTLLIFVISCQMLSMGITFVFPHLFYIPILISAYYYPKKGIYAAAGISLFYVIPVIFFFSGDIIVISSALIRMLMFIVIAALVSYLVEKSRGDQEENEHLLEFQNRIIENPRVMVTVSDSENRVIIWNKGAENISGYPKSEVLGRSDIWSRLLSDYEETKKLKSRIRDLISTPGSIDWVPLTLVRKDGEVRYVVVSLQTMNSKPGEASNILGIAVDITENRRLEAENRTALNQIENNVSKMYILNDQIRNPLAIILGQIEINQSTSRQIICEQVIQINDIISQLDRDSIESTKIIDYLRKHYGFFNEEQ